MLCGALGSLPIPSSSYLSAPHALTHPRETRMPTLYDVPIESFESRYSTQWRKWFSNFYDQKAVKWYPVTPKETLTRDIETGSFLDVHGTNYYKAEQLQLLIELLHLKEIKDGDWVFFHDLWFPGIEMLAYIRDASGVKFNIAGCLHAGGWDPNDFISREMLTMWRHPFEEMLFGIADKIFVATAYHKELIMQHFTKPSRGLPYFENEVDPKLKVTGFPIYPNDFAPSAGFRHKLPGHRPLVVFPHRLDDEKNPLAFEQLKQRPELKGFDFLRSKDVCRTKAEYYKLLHQANYAVSFSFQETWGIAMQEAAFCGAITFVPDRLSYREMYSPVLRYETMDQLVSKLLLCEHNLDQRAFHADAQQDTNYKLKVSGEAAIEIMMRSMGVVQ